MSNSGRGENGERVSVHLLAEALGLGGGGHLAQVGDGVEAGGAIGPMDGETAILFEGEMGRLLIHCGHCNGDGKGRRGRRRRGETQRRKNANRRKGEAWGGALPGGREGLVQ